MRDWCSNSSFGGLLSASREIATVYYWLDHLNPQRMQKHAHILCETDHSFLLQTQTHSPSHTHYYCLSFISFNFLHVRMTSCHPTPTKLSPPDEENILARYHILDTSSTDGERIQKIFSTKPIISESGSYLLIDFVLVSFSGCWWWEQRFLTWCSYIARGNHLPHVLRPLSQRSRSGQLWSGQL